MKTHDLDSWNDFRPLIDQIREQYGVVRRNDPDEAESPPRLNRILFRGQAKNDWKLETTLERATSDRVSLGKYVQIAHRCENELESFTGKGWNLPEYKDLPCLFMDQDSLNPTLPRVIYQYLAYLRHHGFPSPLLDWTESPYIAAYFAYCDRPPSDRVAIFAYSEFPMGMKTGFEGAPQIGVLGPYITTHPRHFAQKCCYTICTEWCRERKQHYFCSHEEVFKGDDDCQDVLVKITLPSSERRKVLGELNDYNINHFTLFQSEDALVKALAMRQFDLKSQ